MTLTSLYYFVKKKYFSQKVAEVEKFPPVLLDKVDSSQSEDTAEVEDDWLDQSR